MKIEDLIEVKNEHYGYDDETDVKLNKLKLDLFNTILDAINKNGKSFDSEILFEGFMADLTLLYYEVAAKMKDLEDAKE